jgi:hypothetical protein
LVKPLNPFSLIILADHYFTTFKIVDPDAMLLSLFLFKNYFYTIDPGANISAPVRPLEDSLAVLFVVFKLLGPKIIINKLPQCTSCRPAKSINPHHAFYSTSTVLCNFKNNFS